MQTVVDVSYHNGTIDWDKVRQSGNHAIIRCGYIRNGKRVTDSEFKRNADACKRLGIPFGCYLYSYAVTATEALKEAEWAIELCKPYRDVMAYPLFFDSEQKGTEEIAGVNATIFCNNVRNAGFVPGIYASQYWWQTYLSKVSREYVRWVARWSAQEPETAWAIWQYTNKGTCPGIPSSSEGGVDMSRSKYTVDAPEPVPASKVDDLADEVMQGLHGNGEARRKSLGASYDVVQAIVNYRLNPDSMATKTQLGALANAVIKGAYGNGDARKSALGSIYEPVQKIVNQKVSK